MSVCPLHVCRQDKDVSPQVLTELRLQCGEPFGREAKMNARKTRARIRVWGEEKEGSPQEPTLGGMAAGEASTGPQGRQLPGRREKAEHCSRLFSLSSAI